jgi:hypothetical protein
MRTHLAFGTMTKFALDASQRPDQTVDVSMGYDRGELASVPTGGDEDAGDGQDAYSVLGTFYVRYGNPFDDGIRLNQFFATGRAALTAARSDRFRRFFGRQAAVVALEGAAENFREAAGKAATTAVPGAAAAGR